MKPRVYAVLVFVRYVPAGGSVAPPEAMFTVRALASNPEQAQLAAMRHAETLKPENIELRPDTKRYAYRTEILFPMTEVDCIGESLKPAEAPAPTPTFERCSTCGNTGWKVLNREYCECPMGKDLQRVERRKAK